MTTLPQGFIPRKKYRRLPEAVVSAMLYDFYTGLTPQAVAKKYGSTDVSVRRALRRYEPQIVFKKAQYVDETGNTYGRLRVVAYAGTRTLGNKKPAYFTCVCTCGMTLTVAGYQLRYGQTLSCGCRRAENKRRKLID